MNTAAIAERLRVSVKTIETYRSNIRAKLGLNDATDLIAGRGHVGRGL